MDQQYLFTNDILKAAQTCLSKGNVSIMEVTG